MCQSGACGRPGFLRCLSPRALCELRVLGGQETCSAPEALASSFLEHNVASRVGIIRLADVSRRLNATKISIETWIRSSLRTALIPRAARRTISVDRSSMCARSHHDDRLAAVPVVVGSAPSSLRRHAVIWCGESNIDSLGLSCGHPCCRIPAERVSQTNVVRSSRQITRPCTGIVVAGCLFQIIVNRHNPVMAGVMWQRYG